MQWGTQARHALKTWLLSGGEVGAGSVARGPRVLTDREVSFHLWQTHHSHMLGRLSLAERVDRFSRLRSELQVLRETGCDVGPEAYLAVLRIGSRLRIEPHVMQGVLAEMRRNRLEVGRSHWLAVLSGLGKTGGDIDSVMEEMKEAGMSIGEAEITCIVTALERSNRGAEGLALFNKYAASHHISSAATFTPAIKCCKALEETLPLLKHVTALGIPFTLRIMNALLKVCAKSRDIEGARTVIALVERTPRRNIILYTSLMDVYFHAAALDEAWTTWRVIENHTAARGESPDVVAGTLLMKVCCLGVQSTDCVDLWVERAEGEFTRQLHLGHRQDATLWEKYLRVLIAASRRVPRYSTAVTRLQHMQRCEGFYPTHAFVSLLSAATGTQLPPRGSPYWRDRKHALQTLASAGPFLLPHKWSQ
eukprot:Sspe_Gene.103303::Locus_79124_Transcript_1_1_Confidence_1.000_Length_1335::g.103303::m.103303